jgi:hypothetical protein
MFAESRQEPVILGLFALVLTVMVGGLSALASGISFMSASSANAFSGRRNRRMMFDDSGFPPGWPEEVDGDDFGARYVMRFRRVSH